MIATCWREYPSIVPLVDRELAELRTLATSLRGQGWRAVGGGGRWTGRRDDRRRATIRSRLGNPAVLLLQPYRGSDLAPRLLATAEAHARAAGATRIVLWSDTRFDRAHRFYEKHSYIRHGPIGVLRRPLQLAGVRLRQAGLRHRGAGRRRRCVSRAAAGRNPVRLRRCGCLGVVSAAAGARRRARILEACRHRCRRGHAHPACGLGRRGAGRNRDAGIRVLAEPAASRRGAEAVGASRQRAGEAWHAR